MLDDFFTRALIGAIGLALITGPLGCFIVWRRMAYFGDTMAHSALLGIALALLLNLSVMAGVFGVAVIVSLALLLLQARNNLHSDALLGILSHSSLALGMVVIAFMSWIRVDLMSYLFGDVLAISKTDIIIIYMAVIVVLGILALIWRSLLTASIDFDLAKTENLKPERAQIIFMLLMAATIAIAMKIVGILLITSLLIIPAATARKFATGPEQMAMIAAIIGVIAVIGGLSASLQFDAPSGPAIVVTAFLLFLASHLRLSATGKQRR